MYSSSRIAVAEICKRYLEHCLFVFSADSQLKLRCRKIKYKEEIS